MTNERSSDRAAGFGETAGCACLNLRMAARAVTQMYDEALRPAGLKATQFSVLAAVAAHGPAPMTRIADALVMDRTTLTRNLKPLAKKGLVKTGRARDARQRTIAVTARGREALARALPLWRGAQDRIVGGLGYARWRGAARLLEEAVALSR